MIEWTPERVDLLKKMWGQGLSASQIAARLGNGVTRNAVIGKVHRLNLSRRAASPRRHEARAVWPQREPKPDAAKSAKPRHKTPSLPAMNRTFASSPLHSQPSPPPQLAPKPYRPGKPAGILDVTGCRFSVGTSPSVIGGHVFCNAQVSDGTSYCEHHASIVFNTAPPVKFTPRSPAHKRAVKQALYRRAGATS